MAWVVDLGKDILYEDAYALQKKLLQMRQKNVIEDTLLLLEHQKVITMGISAHEEHILYPKAFLEAKGFGVYQTDRGGDVTYHGPGQLVGYFIFRIKDYNLTIREFVYNMEEVIIQCLKKNYEIEAKRIPKFSGVWIGAQKITAVGCALKREVTMHGFGFNVCPDLADFNCIVPCGISDKAVTSLEKIIGQRPSMSIVKKQVIDTVNDLFHTELQQISIQQLMEEQPQ